MPAKPEIRVAILGAGPAGLGAAYMLAQRGFRVVVFEKLDRVGGNAGSFKVADIPVDFGSHRFHPASDPDILDMVRDLLGDQLLERPRHGRIHLMGHWLHFPLKASNLLVHSPPRFVIGVIMDLLAKLVPAGKQADNTFAGILSRGLGPTICKEFYFPYARKIWGIEPAEISPIQAQKRVSAGSISSMLRKLVPFLPGSNKSKNKGIFYYPRQGFGQICDSLYNSALKAGVDIKLNATIRGLVPGPGEAKVEFEHQGELQSENFQYIWSTIPVTVLTDLVTPPAPESVSQAARSLHFRAMVLIYLVLDTRQFTEFDAHYFPAENIRITRLSEPRNYSNLSKPDDTTVLCAELPCQPGDETWSMESEALGQLVLDDLKVAGIPVECDVRQVIVKRLPQAYPVYGRDFEIPFETLDNWVDELDNFITFGRQGLFAHDNTHHALYMARAAVQCLGSDGSFDHERWIRERDIFETHVVED